METLRLDRTLWPAVALLIGAFVFFEFTDMDLLVQDQLYDFSKQRWLVDAQARGIKLGFYDLPKAGIIAIGLILLTLALGPERWRARFPIASPARRNLWVAFLTLGSVPALIGQLKATTNTFCPSEIRRYGGDVPYVKVIESYPSNDRPARRGRCFPAGHASGGFALLALAGIVRSRRGQLTAIGLALAVGWAMGFYAEHVDRLSIRATGVSLLLAIPASRVGVSGWLHAALPRRDSAFLAMAARRDGTGQTRRVLDRLAPHRQGRILKKMARS